MSPLKKLKMHTTFNSPRSSLAGQVYPNEESTCNSTGDSFVYSLRPVSPHIELIGTYARWYYFVSFDHRTSFRAGPNMMRRDACSVTTLDRISATLETLEKLGYIHQIDMEPTPLPTSAWTSSPHLLQLNCHRPFRAFELLIVVQRTINATPKVLNSGDGVSMVVLHA